MSAAKTRAMRQAWKNKEKDLPGVFVSISRKQDNPCVSIAYKDLPSAARILNALSQLYRREGCKGLRRFLR